MKRLLAGCFVWICLGSGPKLTPARDLTGQIMKAKTKARLAFVALLGLYMEFKP